MKKTNCLFTLWVTTLCAGACAYAVGTAPAVLSNYGEIQSVKGYSSNPFWNKNSPYNQNFPKPIYATGADLNTGDCSRVVENLVTSYCAEHNYCSGLRIADVRPTIMVQLSQLPGHNFATSCGGYIDSAFDKFQKTYGNVSAVNLPNSTTQTTTAKISNPFAQKLTAEQAAIADRTAELERLQSITTPTPGVQATNFPKTIADISFTDRIANTTAGYEPYKNMEPYKKPNFLGEDEAFFDRLKKQNFEKYCERRPDDEGCKKLREHSITYITFGSNTKCTPEKYETGKGANITCIPARDLSTFVEWCTGYDTATDTYSGCSKTQTIAATDTDDKVYYAKWKCTKPEYEQTQNACIDPNAGRRDDDDDDDSTCPKIADHRDPATCECYPSDFMDSADCNCRGISTWDTTKKKCVCPITDTSNLAITEFAYTKTMCKCPPTKPNFNATTHQCEKDGSTPSNVKYAVIQCRPKHGTTPPIGSFITPDVDLNSRASFDCANSNNNTSLLQSCITPCQVSPSTTGYLNQILSPVLSGEFCSGYRGNMGTSDSDRNVYFFSEKEISPTVNGNGTYVSNAFAIKYTQQQIDDMKATIKTNASEIATKCHDSKRSWWIYILKFVSETQLEVTEAIKLSDK
ncbi:MAG: hypothetical protein J6Y07_03080 [Alphaproteobacteria bacterium]|nr:hypothetical protein [Alphaproteobacteria bacterium]